MSFRAERSEVEESLTFISKGSFNFAFGFVQDDNVLAMSALWITHCVLVCHFDRPKGAEKSPPADTLLRT